VPASERTHRPSLLLGAIALLVIALCGCGGGGSPSEVVAEVGNTAITKALLDHWTRIEAIVLYNQMPTSPVPKGVVPDPPRYTACVAYLRATPYGLAAKKVLLTEEQLRSQCRARYQTVRQTALSFLITWNWIIGEGTDRGLTASEAVIRKRLEQVKHAEFATESAFRHHLALTGETISDRLLRSKVKVFSAGLERKLLEGLTPRQAVQVSKRFVGEFPRRWAAKTNCRRGYVVPNCRQYKGPLPPTPVI
jgi:foldase protein PrsA